MVERRIAKQVEDALRRQAAVALIGPRQAGKTTLALQLAASRDALYLDLENNEDRARLADPALFFEHAQDRLVILDEIHRMPDLFSVLRGVIDKGRRIGKGTGRFLILGSASLDLLRHSGESLAGRIAYIDLTPLTALEVENDLKHRDRLWLRGGFPDSYLATNDRDSLAMRKDFIRSYLERDVPMFSPRIPAETLGRLWTMLAHRQGSLLNASELGRSLAISAQSVTRYIDLLVDLLLIRRLQPYHVNVGKRLVKSPKVFVRDSGLVHALLGIGTLEELAGHPVAGMSWEGFVVETLLSVLPWRAQAFFYRTVAGAEIDLLVRHGNGALWAIEVKRGLAGRVERGFYTGREDVRPERAFVVHASDDRFPLSKGVEALGLWAMAQELASQD